MKIQNFPVPAHRHQSGSAVIVLMGLLGIMLIFVAANTVAVRTLQKELKLIEKKQVQRLQTAAPTQSRSK